ncbi:response regulator transcription factor [Kribbella sp. NBC_00359]|uniref:response regulator transcription factor n=1 Tax=Kribbella sp. NBC_00359 TaxID=2975966 RepID=UPI002E238E5C
MNPILRDARILVADDQVDVAKTLCHPLRAAGAVVRQVADGQQALDEVLLGGYDLLILDMKMPPDDWGGLWVLERLKDAGSRLPVMALSGEGGQRQTVQALRLGAKNWIFKEDAFSELEPLCTALLEGAHAEAFEGIAAIGPSPLAHRFARYRAAPPGRVVTEGLRAFEGVIQFAALLGLATLEPAEAGPLRGFSADQIARPSLGTWNSLLNALRPAAVPGSAFSTLCRALSPHKKSTQDMRSLVKLRNDIAHSGYEPTDDDSNALRRFLVEAAHRITSNWPWQVGVATSMDYDGAAFDVQTLCFIGLGQPRPVVYRSNLPIRSGTVLLLRGDGSAPVSVSPWFSSVDGVLHVLDGIKQRRRSQPDPVAPMLFADPITGNRDVEVLADPGANWSRLDSWIDG